MLKEKIVKKARRYLEAQEKWTNITEKRLQFLLVYQYLTSVG